MKATLLLLLSDYSFLFGQRFQAFQRAQDDHLPFLVSEVRIFSNHTSALQGDRERGSASGLGMHGFQAGVEKVKKFEQLMKAIGVHCVPRVFLLAPY